MVPPWRLASFSMAVSAASSLGWTQMLACRWRGGRSSAAALSYCGPRRRRSGLATAAGASRISLWGARRETLILLLLLTKKLRRVVTIAEVFGLVVFVSGVFHVPEVTTASSSIDGLHLAAAVAPEAEALYFSGDSLEAAHPPQRPAESSHVRGVHAPASAGGDAAIDWVRIRQDGFGQRPTLASSPALLLFE